MDKQKGRKTMTTVNVNIGTVAAVKDFNSKACQQKFDIDIVSGRYIIDAKSLMGVLSLDLSKEVELRICAEGEEVENFLDEIGSYIVK